MTNFGTAFRKIRQSKNLSLESVAAGIMSKQGLSSFERKKQISACNYSINYSKKFI